MLLLCKNNEKTPLTKLQSSNPQQTQLFTQYSTLNSVGDWAADSNPTHLAGHTESLDFAHTGPKRERRSRSSPQVDSRYTLRLRTLNTMSVMTL